MLDKSFVLAGKAIFTIECPDGRHYTYRVDHVPANGQWQETWFVKLLTGPNNNDDYSYMGKMNAFTGHTYATAKSILTEESFPFRLLNRTMNRVWGNQYGMVEQAGFKLHHEGKCGCCGRRLTTPESVESGIGPICAGRM